jgi:hypothetical protein
MAALQKLQYLSLVSKITTGAFAAASATSVATRQMPIGWIGQAWRHSSRS